MAYAADVVLKESRKGMYLGRILRTDGEPKIDIRQTFKGSNGEQVFTPKGIRLTLSEMLGMLTELMGEPVQTLPPVASKPAPVPSAKPASVAPVKLADIIEATLSDIRPDDAPISKPVPPAYPVATVSPEIADAFFPNGLPPGTTIDTNRPGLSVKVPAPAPVKVSKPAPKPVTPQLPPAAPSNPHGKRTVAQIRDAARKGEKIDLSELTEALNRERTKVSA